MGDRVEVFRTAVGESLTGVPDPDLEAALDDAITRARAEFPGLALDEDAFVKFLAERVSEEEIPHEALGKRCVEDMFLAFACVRDDPAALQMFDQRCLGPIGPAIRRIDPSPSFLDEVRQSVRVSLLVTDGSRAKRLATYKGAGKLRSWVQVGAVRTALELRRKSRPQDSRDDEALIEAADLDDDPELKHIKQLYRAEFRVAFQDALRSLETRQRNVLRMYLVDGLNIDQIGLVYRVHRATVARWIARAREQLLEETRSRLVATLKLTDTQFDSLMVVVRSHLDLSMERLLVEDD